MATAFEVFQNDPFDSTSISGNYIKTILEDSKGRLWVGTTNGLNLFDRKTESFQRLLPPNTAHQPEQPISHNYPGLSHRDINCSLEDGEGNIWLGTMHGGVTKLEMPAKSHDLAQAKFTVFSKTAAENSLWDHPVNSMAIDETGAIWVLSYGQISIVRGSSLGKDYRIQRMHWSDFDPQWKNYDQSDFRYNENGIDRIDRRFHMLLQDDEGAVWVKSAGGFAKWQPIKNRFEPYHLDIDLQDYNAPPLAGANGPNLFDQNGHIWMSGGWSVVVYDPDSYQILDRYYQEEKLKLGLPKSAGCSSLLEDPLGNIWLGTNGNGLFKYTPQIKKFAGHNGTMCWKGNSVRSIYETNDGTLWLGLTNLRLLRMDRATGQTEEVVLDRDRWSRTHAHELDYVYAMQEDRSGNLWLGTQRGLFQFKLSDGELADWSFFEIKRNQGEGEASPVLNIHFDADGQLWLLTHFEFGRFDPASGQFEGQDYLGLINGERMPATYPCIYQQKNGTFWLGTSWGLLRFDPETNGFTFFTNDPKNKNSLSQRIVKCIHPDPSEPERMLWIGTGGGGLNRFDLGTENFTHFKKQDGLPNNVVYGILGDKEDLLWLSTNQGLSRFNPQTGAFKNYGVENGLQDNEFNSGAYFKSRSGEFFFGGINGVNAFRPEEVKDNLFLPTVKITGFKLANQAVDFKDSKSPLRQPISETKELVLSWKDKIFSFEFASLDLTAPGHNQYAYRMDGFHDDWQYSGTDRSATFTNLNPGEYTFRVKGSNHDGVWSERTPLENEEGSSLKIIILPPWWQTWWAYLSYVLLLGSAVFGFYKFQLNRQLERAEADRLKEMDVLKSRLYTNITHEFRTPLTVIMGMTEELRAEIGKLGGVQFLNFQFPIDLIRRNSQNLLRLINQLLDLSKLDSGHLKLHAVQADIIPYLQYLTESFYSMAQEKNVRLVFYPEVEKLVMDFDEEKVQHIVYNLLSNAIKFTANGGKIVFHALRAETPLLGLGAGQPILKLKVSDTGLGIPAKNLQHIFDRFYQVDASATRKGEGTGIGLALTKELVELMNGKISVQSEVGKGTAFTIHLPIKKEAPITKPAMNATQTPQARLETDGLRTGGLKTDKPLLLIVEDNPDVTAYIRQILQSDYQIETAVNGRLGIEKALEIIPDLIISDVMMPEKDGFELTKTLKTDERTSHIPIILLTAKATDEDKITGLKTGADAYLMKPFNKEELLVRLEKLLELRKALQLRYGGASASANSTPSAVSTEAAAAELSIEDLFLQKLQKTVEKNLDDPSLNAAQLAQAVHLSQSQLYRKLKALTDESPNIFIRKIRLHRAVEMLKNPELNISEIAYSVGFNDPNYFSRAFHKEFGGIAAGVSDVTQPSGCIDWHGLP